MRLRASDGSQRGRRYGNIMKAIKTIKEGASHSSVIRGQRAGCNKNNEPYVTNESKRKAESSYSKLQVVVKGARPQECGRLRIVSDYLFYNRAQTGTAVRKTAGEFESRLGYYIFKHSIY